MYKTIINTIPNNATNTAGSNKFPNLTFVAGSPTMIPAFCNPTNAMKNPIPAPIAARKLWGIASISFLRNGVNVIPTKITH